MKTRNSAGAGATATSLDGGQARHAASPVESLPHAPVCLTTRLGSALPPYFAPWRDPKALQCSQLSAVQGTPPVFRQLCLQHCCELRRLQWGVHLHSPSSRMFPARCWLVLSLSPVTCLMTAGGGTLTTGPCVCGLPITGFPYVASCSGLQPVPNHLHSVAIAPVPPSRSQSPHPVPSDLERHARCKQRPAPTRLHGP